MLLNLSIAAQEGQRNLFFNSNTDVVRLDFSDEPPTPYLTGIAGSYEGIAHFEDGNGNLLFWFNSNGMYDANANFMPGSWGIFADASSAEVCISPVPEQDDKYYVFYNAQTCSNLYYSVVDMSITGGGSIGDVVELNTLIDAGSYSEGLEVVQIPGTPNYWLLSYDCNQGFKKSLINPDGVSEPCLFHTYPSPSGGFDGRGEFDYHKGRIGMCYAWSNAVFTGEFNPETGVLTNPLTLNDPAISSNVFGVEFSPDGTKMYFSLWYFPNINNVFQYNFDNDILSSWLPNYGPGSSWISGLGEIELGLNGKLYIIEDGGSNILTIENPNDSAGDIVFSSIPIGTTTGLGISDHIQSYFFETEEPEPECVEIGSALELTHGLVDNETQWHYTDDPTNILFVGETYTGIMGEDILNISATNTNAGDACFDGLTVSIDFTISPIPQVDPGADQTIGIGETTAMTATVIPAGATVYWYPTIGLADFTSLTTDASPTETTTYSLTVINGDCEVQEQMTIFVFDKIIIQDTICAEIGSTVNLSLPSDTLTNHSWTDVAEPDTELGNTPTYSTNVSNAIVTYSGTTDNVLPDGTGLIHQTTIIPLASPNAGADITIQAGQTALLIATGADDAGYLWNADPSIVTSDLSQDSLEVMPNVTTTYTLNSAYDPFCPTNDQVTVIVTSEEESTLCSVIGEIFKLEIPDDNYDTITWYASDNLNTPLETGLEYSATTPNSSVSYTAIADAAGTFTNFNFTVFANPIIDAGPDQTITEGEQTSLNLTNNGTNPISISWEPASELDDATSENPTTNILTTTTFTATSTTEDGCVNTDAVTVNVKIESYVLIPSGFSPNNDNVNDVLYLVPFNIEELVTFRIFNRWGQLVFETNDITKGWDGTFKGDQCEMGVYACYAVVIDRKGKEYMEKGNITLIK